MLKHIIVKGNYYSCGRQLGKIMKKSVHHRLNSAFSDSFFRKCRDDLKNIHETCDKYYPQYIKQLKGIATGAGVDYWRILLLNSPELRESRSGCTSIAKSIKGKVELFHNEDGWGGERIKDCALVTYKYKHMTIHAFIYAGFLPGYAYSWNSKGTYFSVNYLIPINLKPLSHVPRHFSACALTEARNIKDASRILRVSPDASGFHYYFGFQNEMLSIEQFHDKLSVKKIKGIDLHTNHYLHEFFGKKIPTDKNSIIRNKRGRDLIKKHTESLSILSDRNNPPNAICGKFGEKLHTLSTVHFSPLENKVTIYSPHTNKKIYELKLKN
ncbi:MAG: hypothetical protein US50_C0065G0005 [Candidatus Nomurabacteria bacterium GW2011_GWB1_37_5]|uniref:Peptidase C45 hydrolase domain-containing protein n=1 Tax=Candidatus Nomurabacteria bacterium GW2011_GWB1_37_5 TaxID=1618742 RepID=A0A0G0JBA8_9BACT|nr:MAG: hypothetical protein US50_C0065G0005 [Candidatus Nomurabacteria bacterium GW2011_GWB1_37_5]